VGAVSYRNVIGTSVCVVLLGMGLTWAFVSMRAVMGVGGSCASGQTPYQISTPCPDGSWLIAVGIPMMIIAAMAGSAFATGIDAPNLLVPMWAVLFTSLGFNFLQYGIADTEWGFLVPGVLFEAMALPAWWAMGSSLVTTLRTKRSGLGWWATYVGLGACGTFLGLAIYAAAS
jgi:hypothetical protein